MKKNYLTILALAFVSFVSAQTVCNPSGNLVIYANYDGGTLNINVDQNIPNLKIGIVSYEAVSVTISGTFASNLTGIAYAGYNNSPNTNCSPSIATTAFSGIGSATSNIAFLPPATLANPNGYTSIDCAYSCSTTTSQGGCNTIDQVENYFLTYFPGSSIFSTTAQYGCWSATEVVSSGGNCCPLSTGITTFSAENTLSVFPNPATNTITISSASPLNKASVKIFNVSGQLVKETNGINGSATTVDITELSQGIFFIETTNAGVVSHTRFIKE